MRKSTATKPGGDELILSKTELFNWRFAIFILQIHRLETAPDRKPVPRKMVVEIDHPRLVAMATDRTGNFYEGAAGTREFGQDRPMTADAVFAVFSATKALTGTCILQLVEEGA